MDTDDLSREAYKGIIIEAEKLTHDLTLHYGMLSYDCKNETEYLEKAELLTKRIMKFNEEELDDFFWSTPPNKERLNATLKKILASIEKSQSFTN